MRAFLLAAGLGERLRPLTNAKPKALVPVANKPAIVRLLDLLQSHGIKEAYVNLHYLPEDIKDVVGGGSWWNMRVHYSYEPELLGTAGAIGKVRKFLADDRFLLINTDIVTDIDLVGAIEQHEKTGAKATLILATPRRDPDYQWIGVNSDGRILMGDVQEEQFRSGVYTGIGIFEPSVLEIIPKGYSSLLDSVLIPLATEGSLYTYFPGDYWVDIGSVERYMQANMDLIDAKTRLPIEGRMVGDRIWIDETAEIDLTVQIEEPVLIGKRVSIERGAKIGPYAVIGDGCIIGPKVEISNSIVWDKCRIGSASTIDSSVIADSQQIAQSQKVKRTILQDGVAEPMFNL